MKFAILILCLTTHFSLNAQGQGIGPASTSAPAVANEGEQLVKRVLKTATDPDLINKQSYAISQLNANVETCIRNVVYKKVAIEKLTDEAMIIDAVWKAIEEFCGYSLIAAHEVGVSEGTLVEYLSSVNQRIKDQIKYLKKDLQEAKKEHEDTGKALDAKKD